MIIGCVLSLSMGFLDVAISMLSEPPGFSSFPRVLPPLVATIGVFFLIYLILWFLIASPLGYFLKLETTPLALSLALFLGMIFTLGSLNNLIRFSLSPTEILQLFLLVLIAFSISIGAYFTTEAVVHTLNDRHAALFFSLTLPFMLAEMFVFIWLCIYRYWEPFQSMPFLGISIGILILLFTITLFHRIGQKMGIARSLTTLMTLVVLSPLMTLVATKDSKVSAEGFKETAHQIKHVILITVDTLRADVLSSYNHQGASTPHIDQLAKDGILFTYAISAAPWTLPAVASIMTGLSPSVHMMRRQESRLPDSLPTLAEYMRDAGYFTAAIGYNHFLTSKHNISQGFLEYNFFPKPSIGSSFGARLLQRLFPNQVPLKPSTHDLTKLAIQWLEANYEKDSFLWIHYYDPHLPYTPPADHLPTMEPPPAIGTKFSRLEAIRTGLFVPSLTERKWIKALYEAEVRYVDDNIRELLDTLKRLNIYNESLIILTSDHGEEFWEHGGYEHGHTLYNELLWVPLIIKLPQSASKGQISTAVSTQSIMPTVLDVCGIDYDSKYLSAESLSSLWRHNPNAFQRPMISTGVLYYEDRESVIFDGLKYIRSLLTNREELFYDLTRIPQEQISTLSSSPDKVQRARNTLREHNQASAKLRDHYGVTDGEEIKFDKEIARQLKSLGYIQ